MQYGHVQETALRLMSVLSFLIVTSHAASKDLRVPESFPTIQDALLEAESEDRIVVPGDFLCTGAIILTRPVTLTSEPPGARVEVADGNALEVRNGATRVTIDGFTITSTTGTGVIVYPNVSPDTELNLSNVFCTGSGRSGLASRQDINLFLRKSTFSGNRLHGVWVTTAGDANKRTGSVTIRDCVMADNGSYGIAIEANRKNKQYTVEIVRSVVKNGFGGILLQAFDVSGKISACDVSDNKRAGVDVVAAGGALKIQRCRLSENAGFGISLRSIGRSPRVNVGVNCIDTTISGSARGVVMEADDGYIVSVLKTDSEAEYAAGTFGHYAMLSRPGGILLKNVRIEDTVRPVVAEKYKRRLDYVLGKPWFKGATVEALTRSSIEKGTDYQATRSLVLAAEFSDVEKNLQNWDGDGLVAAIGETFAKQYKKHPLEAGPEALRYLAENPESSVACRLLQNMMGTVLRPDTADNAEALLAIVAKHPNSAVADVICTNMAMKSLCYGLPKDVRTKMAATQVPGDSIAGVLLAGSLNVSTTGTAGLELFENTYTDAAKCNPQARKAALGEVLGQRQSIRMKDVVLNLKHSEIACLCLYLEGKWRLLGKPELSRRFFELARQHASVLEPGSPFACYLSPELHRDLRASQIALYGSDGEEAGKAETAKADGDTSAAIQTRLNAYGNIRDYADQLGNFAILAGDSKPSGIRDECLQALLDEFVAFLKQKHPEADLIASYGQTLKTILAGGFKPEEAAAAIAWLSEQGDPVMTGNTDREVTYHEQIADLFQWNKDSGREAERRLMVAKGWPKKTPALKALERLTDLYLSVWQLPEKAIEMQREIVTGFSGSELEFAARLRIGKILYEAKQYPKAVFELTQLLAKMPPEIKQEPARMMLGLAYIASGSYDEARNELAKVINSDQGEFREKSLYLTGYSYISQQKYADAVKPFSDLQNLYPNGTYSGQAQAFLQKVNAAR